MIVIHDDVKSDALRFDYQRQCIKPKKPFSISIIVLRTSYWELESTNGRTKYYDYIF